jgi:hypothetical protein
VFSLVLILLVIGFIAAVVLAAGTLWFQGYIYSEPVGSIAWRAPAAAAAIILFVAFWVWLDYRAPGRYRGLHEFSVTETRPPFAVLRVPNRDGKVEVYKQRKDARGRIQYLRNGEPGGKSLPSRPDRIIALEGDREYLFEPLAAQRDARGNYQVQPGELLRYRNAETGWEMAESHLGQVYIFHTGWLVANVVLNLLHLLVWFLVLWLLLHYQWPHALGLAVVCWLVMTLAILPMVFRQAEDLAGQRAAAPATTLAWPGQPVPNAASPS